MDNKLFTIPEIQQAFAVAIVSRLQDYGYFDMNQFIKVTKTKTQFRKELQNAHSKYEVLYTKPYPSEEKAYEFWASNIDSSRDEQLSPLEANAIISWIYRTIKNQRDRMVFTKELFASEFK